MAVIGDKKLNCTIIAESVSFSGKYRIFLGIHYNKGHSCHDVGAYNKETGEVIRRHYADKPTALIFWNDFRQKMEQAPVSELSDETDPLTEA